jgi:major membrane immunogen (membrane-anchored lipoprotein)
MFSHSALARRSLIVAAVSAVAVVTSCGRSDDGLGKRYAVSGNVTYNGNPLEKGSISFVPEDPKGVGATGTIENGSYALSTGGNNDGAQAGKYKVTITAKEDAQAQAKADFAKENKGLDPGYVPGRYVAGAEARAKSLIPVGYGDPRTTNLKAEVEAKSNSFDFKLSDADAPPPPPKAAPAKGTGR